MVGVVLLDRLGGGMGWVVERLTGKEGLVAGIGE